MSMHIRSSRRTALASAAVVALTTLTALTLPSSAYAYDERSTAPINVDADGLALKSYDPVSYRSVGGPIKGNANFSGQHDGATYWFANVANRDTARNTWQSRAPGCPIRQCLRSGKRSRQ